MFIGKDSGKHWVRFAIIREPAAYLEKLNLFLKVSVRAFIFLKGVPDRFVGYLFIIVSPGRQIVL